MDREVIERKLESLRHCLRRIEAKCPADPQTLANDPDLQDIVALNLSRAQEHRDSQPRSHRLAHRAQHRKQAPHGLLGVCEGCLAQVPARPITPGQVIRA